MGIIKKWKIFGLLLSFLLIGVFTASCAEKSGNTGTTEQPEQKKVAIRFAVNTPAGDWRTNINEDFAKSFNERAGGGYEIKVYPGEVLAKPPEMLDSVRTGAIEMMSLPMAMNAGAEPKFSATMLPYLFNNPKAIIAAGDDLRDLYDPIFEKQFNQKLLCCFYVGTFQLTTKDNPIKSIADVKKLIIGGGDPGLLAVVTLLGGSPVSIPFTDFYTSLDKGVIDGIIDTADSTLTNKLSDMVKYFTKLGTPLGTVIYTINLDIWNGMPKDVQDILMEEARASAEKMNDSYISKEEKDIETIRNMGIEVIELPKEEIDKFKETCDSYRVEKLAEMGEFGRKLKEIADKANSENL